VPVNDRYYVRISSIASIFFAISPTPSSVAPPDLFDSAYSDVGRVTININLCYSSLRKGNTFFITIFAPDVIRCSCLAAFISILAFFALC
jgi:hypothetical protein